MKYDSQQVGMIGTSLLEAELVLKGFEIGRPNRDRGIDLIIYRDAPNLPFAAVPIQVKATKGMRFDLNRKYARLIGLVLAYIWNVEKEPRIFLLTYDEALGILGDAKKTKSWTANGYYAWTNFVSLDRIEALRQFENRWDWLRLHLDKAAIAKGRSR